MDNKVKGGIAVVVVGVAGYFGFMTASWGLFCMKVGERMKNLNRFATPDAVLQLKNDFKEDALHYKVSNAETITTDMLIEARNVGDVIMYFLVINVHIGPKNYKDEARIESQAQMLENRKRLEDAGVKFKNMG